MHVIPHVLVPFTPHLYLVNGIKAYICFQLFGVNVMMTIPLIRAPFTPILKHRQSKTALITHNIPANISTHLYVLNVQEAFKSF